MAIRVGPPPCAAWRVFFRHAGPLEPGPVSFGVPGCSVRSDYRRLVESSSCRRSLGPDLVGQPASSTSHRRSTCCPYSGSSQCVPIQNKVLRPLRLRNPCKILGDSVRSVGDATAGPEPAGPSSPPMMSAACPPLEATQRERLEVWWSFDLGGFHEVRILRYTPAVRLLIAVTCNPTNCGITSFPPSQHSRYVGRICAQRNAGARASRDAMRASWSADGARYGGATTLVSMCCSECSFIRPCSPSRVGAPARGPIIGFVARKCFRQRHSA